MDPSSATITSNDNSRLMPLGSAKPFTWFVARFPAAERENSDLVLNPVASFVSELLPIPKAASVLREADALPSLSLGHVMLKAMIRKPILFAGRRSWSGLP